MALESAFVSNQLRSSGLSTQFHVSSETCRGIRPRRSCACQRSTTSLGSASHLPLPSSLQPRPLGNFPVLSQPPEPSLPLIPAPGRSPPHQDISVVTRAKPRKSSGGKSKGKGNASPSLNEQTPKTRSPPSPSIVTTNRTPADSLILPLHETSSLSLPPGPPESEDEALRQAGACLAAAISSASKAAEPMTLRQRRALGQAGRRVKGGIGDSASARIQVEIPVRDDTPSAQVSLVRQLLPFTLPPTNPSNPGDSAQPKSLALFFSSTAAAEAASAEGALGPASASCECFCLKQTQVVPKGAQVVLVVGPTPDQAPQVQAAVGSAGKRPVVILNPGWAAGGPQASARGGAQGEAADALVSGFEVAYCFMPLAFQGLMGSSMGALLCAAPGWDVARGLAGGRAGATEGAVWVLFKAQGKESKRIAVLRRRPNSEELQNLMYANMAAESPVSKSIQFMKSLMGQAA